MQIKCNFICGQSIAQRSRRPWRGAEAGRGTGLETPRLAVPEEEHRTEVTVGGTEAGKGTGRGTHHGCRARRR
jgi:hypothetical protein